MAPALHVLSWMALLRGLTLHVLNEGRLSTQLWVLNFTEGARCLEARYLVPDLRGLILLLDLRTII